MLLYNAEKNTFSLRNPNFLSRLHLFLFLLVQHRWKQYIIETDGLRKDQLLRRSVCNDLQGFRQQATNFLLIRKYALAENRL